MTQRELAMAVAYGFLIGMAVGVALEASGALAHLDQLLADLLSRPGRPRRVLVLNQPLEGRVVREQVEVVA